VAALLMSLVLASFTSFSADVSGVWKLEMRWAEHDKVSTGVCTLKQDNAKLTGKCQENSTITGEVRDRQLTWNVDVNEKDQKGRMTFEGALDDAGTTISGKCAVPDGPTGTFTMKKQ
jgi:hypothetical protein